MSFRTNRTTKKVFPVGTRFEYSKKGAMVYYPDGSIVWIGGHKQMDTPENRKARRERALIESVALSGGVLEDGGIDFDIRTKSGKTAKVWTSWDKAREELRRRVTKAELFGNRDIGILAEVSDEDAVPTKFWLATNEEWQRFANLEGESSNIPEPPVEWRDRWAVGGRTVVENGQSFHKICHKDSHNRQ